MTHKMPRNQFRKALTDYETDPTWNACKLEVLGLIQARARQQSEIQHQLRGKYKPIIIDSVLSHLLRNNKIDDVTDERTGRDVFIIYGSNRS